MQNFTFDIKKLYAALIVLIMATWAPIGTAQPQGCDSIDVAQRGEHFLIDTDPGALVIRADTDTKVLDAICVTIVTAGYYRIYAGIEYSTGQSNESFFLTVRDFDSTFVPQLEPNAGIYKVIADTSDQPSLTIRDAGIFYLAATSYIITLNHYLLIQNEYPDFLNPPGIPITGESPESVHIFAFEFEYLGGEIHAYDVGISKTVNKDSVFTGDEISYEIKIQNYSEYAARHITITDTLPELITVLEFRPAADSTIRNIAFWHLDSLSRGEQNIISYSARIAEQLPDSIHVIVNSAAVVAVNDTNAYNNHAQAEIIAIKRREIREQNYDLSLTKIADRDTIMAGENFRYELSVENWGPAPAYRMTVIDTLPPLVTLSQVDILPDSVHDNILFWNFDSLLSKQVITLGLNVTLAENLPDSVVTIVNAALVSASNDTNGTNDYNTATIIALKKSRQPAEEYELSLIKTASKDTISIGEDFQYEIKILNLGPGTAYSISVTDSLPEIVNTSDYHPEPDSIQGNVLFWSFDSLMVDEEIVISFTASLNQSLPDSTFPLINVATLNAPADTNIIGEEATSRIMVIESHEKQKTDYELRVSKTASIDTVMIGEPFTYEIRIENVGPGTAYQISLTDTLPQALAASDYIPEPDSIRQNILFWNFDSLEAGREIVVSFIAEIKQSGDGATLSLENIATIMVPGDTTFSGKRAKSRIIIAEEGRKPESTYNLGLSKTTSQDTVLVGEEFVYQLNIINYGPGTAHDIMLIDSLPDYITVTEYNPPPDSISNRILYWHLDSLAAGQNMLIYFTALLEATLPHNIMPISNVAWIFAPNDSQKTDNDDEAEIIASENIIKDCEKSFYFDENVFEPDKGKSLTIYFEINSPQTVSLDLFDISGYHVATLVENRFNNGLNEFQWNGKIDDKNIGSGVYIIVLKTNNLSCWKKIIVVR